MSGRAYLRSFRGVFLAALIAGVVLALPTAILWAGRSLGTTTSQKQKRAESENRTMVKRLTWVSAQSRPRGLSPLGENFEPFIPDDQHKKGRVETGLGWLDLKTRDLVLRVSADLRTPDAALHQRGPRGSMQEGVNILQIDKEALGRLGYDAIAKEIGADAKILGVAQDSALIVRAKGKNSLASLAAHPYVVAFAPYDAALKLGRNIGNLKLEQRSRSESPIMQILVTLWQDANPADVEARLQGLVGKGNARIYSIDRTVIKINASTEQIKKVAQDPDVRDLEEQLEYNLTNSEVPTVMMIGSYYDSFMGARPFHEIGVDGGGIDTNLDGQRINDGTDSVPPQIVAVTDNGITYDAVHFSQSLTVPTDATHVVGPTHRKIHSLQTLGSDATGTTCDAVLTGSTTHGNVVSGIIAGAPGDFGLTYTKSIDPQTMPPIKGIPMDALARGSRILFQDVADSSRCLSTELVEVGGEVDPGLLSDRLALAICPRGNGTGACLNIVGGGADVHLHVMPFGIPNFDNIVNNPQNGTYTTDAAAIDKFLINNRDYMVFSPVGNQGTIPNLFRPIWPDLMDGTKKDNDPNNPATLQITPPATAKNSVTVGSSFADNWTVLGDFNAEEAGLDSSSKGPATFGSLRTAPIVMAVGSDSSGLFGYPLFSEAATNRSRDNDNAGTVENEIDEGNAGTSFSAGYATAAGAIIRDYFAQGFYPTATRVAADRNLNVSGSLVRAALVASANFCEQAGTPSDLGAVGRLVDERIFNARAIDADSVAGDFIGVIGNGVQGYGRIVLDQVLPLPNYPPTRGIGLPDTVEYPASGLIVYDTLATGEPPINNTSPINCPTGAGCTEKTFTVSGVNTASSTIHVCSNNSAVSCVDSSTCGTGNTCVARQSNAIAAGQLRIALSWPDPPNTLPSEGTLINDLDLEVESPGPDNLINTTGDNILYTGNLYIDSRVGPAGGGQWSQGHVQGDTFRRDVRNTIEAVHLTSQVASDDPTNQLVTGTWKVRVKRGGGGAIAGQISVINGPNEDANQNGRLDPGEDLAPFNGFLDAGGQPFALVISGPVLGSGSQTWNSQSHAFPQSAVKLDKYQYSCSDSLQAQVLDPSATALTASANLTITVLNNLGQVVDQESALPFSAGVAGSGDFTSSLIPVRFASPGAKNNGIIEGDNGRTIVVSYAGAGRASEARARFQCTPNLIQAAISTPGMTDPFSYIGGGCDRDQYLDANERVTYSIALTNFEIHDDLEDVTATLVPSGPGANAIRVLDSPKNFGRVPGGQKTGVTFSLFVDGAVVNALPISSRTVTLNLTLDGVARGVRTSKTSYSFTHVLNADKESLHYSTDVPGGGHQVRDYNRNLQIDKPDVIDPFTGVFFPDEDLVFQSLFLANGDAQGRITNAIGENVDGSGQFDPAKDYNLNGALDPGILTAGQTAPSATDLVPWNFDTNNGGWHPVRHPQSKPGATIPGNIWEWQRFGICGFQTAVLDTGNLATTWFQNNGAGIWHTGDGDPSTPALNATACDNAFYPTDSQTPPQEEFVYDILLSPVIDKVHQKPDARGFDYGVEFQRLGVNMEIQTEGYSGGSIDIDNNIDSDERNCLLCSYFYNRFPDPYGIISFDRYATPMYYTAGARTFGPLKDPNGSFAANSKIDGDETGFTGLPSTTDTSYRSSPIALAPPNLRPFPDPNVTQPVCNPNRVCSNALTQACTIDANCPGGTCIANPNPDQCETNTVAGPERNLDVVLVDYEDGFVYLSSGPGAVEPTGIYSPGPAASRWMIGIGYYVMEQPTPPGKTDYGLGIDDVVLEWDETHPVDETQFVPPHQPACARAGDTGLGAGQPCATLVVDRLNLYECNETVEVTVDDPRRSASPSVTVFGVTDTDNIPFSTGVVLARLPRKQFQIPAVAGSPGLFKGRITIGSNFDSPDTLTTTPSQDISMTLFYLDPECDGDRDGTLGELSFTNLDGDGVPDAIDNCPHVYNPGQEDADGDGVGDICDNCPNAANGPILAVNPGDNQKDSDADSVGDVCDLDDVDFDGVVNGFDNCPDVYNPLQGVSGGGQKGLGCEKTNSDRDNDGLNDANDNCVRTYNPSQLDSDGDRLGDACDGDCTNPVKTLLATGSCSRTSSITCVDNSVCPTTGICSITATRLCATSADCPNNESCINIAKETCERFGINNSGNCSTLDDDLDRDGIGDFQDNCPTIYNPAIIAGGGAVCQGGANAGHACTSDSDCGAGVCRVGASRQADTDNDGLGDACDPAATLDDDNNGVPDDAITFTTNILCRKLQLGKLTILSTNVRDVNGDHDIFGDPGETVRMTLVLKNAGPQTLTGGTLVLKTVDPDIACISKSTIQIPTLAPGAQLDTATLGADLTAVNPPGLGQFEYMISASTATVNAAQPAHGDFALTLTSNEVLGVSPSINLVTLLDLNLPKVCSTALTQQCATNAQCPAGGICEDPPKFCTGDTVTLCTTNNDCNIAGGTCETAGPLYVIGPLGQADGIIFEDFDTDRDGDGVETLAPQPFGTAGVKNDTIGVTVGTAPGGINLLAAVGCGGFLVPPVDNGCKIDPDNDMDWHIHCPAGTCPNDNLHISTLGKGGPQNHTPHGGAGVMQNSLHWGVHFSRTNYVSDTVKFREIAAFMTNPINLTPFPKTGDLELSFFHIAAMMDNNYYNLKPNQANDYGDVQIQVDSNIDPNIDNWGQWDKLVPFQNVYDHIPYIWSTFGTTPTYCDFTPVDAGNGSTGGYAPRGVREIMCFPSGIWSHCGNQIDKTTIYQCDGPGSPGTENNLWVQSKFSLSNYLGQRVRIRWIAEAWEFDDHNSSYTEVSSWATVTGDEGWWIDDIQITGAIRSSFTPPADTGAPLVPSCPTSTCSSTVTGTDHGFNVVLTVQDESGDGVVVSGEKVTVSAANTTDPGGCSTLRNGSGALIGAGVQYKFLKDGVLAQDWSSNPTYIDNPSLDAQYTVQVRCSADPVNCLSAVTNSAAGRAIPTYPGDGTDINLQVSHNQGTNTTTLTWPSRPQPLLISGYDVFSGTINTIGDPNLNTLTGIACLGNHLNQPAALKVCSGGPTPGATCQFDAQCGTGGTCLSTTLSTTQTGVTPASLKAIYYLVGHHPTPAGAQTALGKRGDNSLRPQVNACP